MSRRAAQLRSAAAKLLRIANELETEAQDHTEVVRSRSTSRGAIWEDLNSEFIISKTLESYKQRRRRKKYLPEELFGEPAWDILLDLFAARLQNRRISVTSACIAADVPPTTALRWLGLLEEMGFIERLESNSDQRVTWVRISDLANQAMFEYFEDGIRSYEIRSDKIEEYLITTKSETKS